MALNIHNCQHWLKRLPGAEEIPLRVGGGWDHYSVTVRIIVQDTWQYHACYIRAKRDRDRFKPGEHTTAGYGRTASEAEERAICRAQRRFGLCLPLPALPASSRPPPRLLQ